jgi:hypothetical protein
LYNGPGHPGIFLSVIKFDYLSTALLSPSLNGTTGEYDYSRRLHDGTPHSQIAITSTHLWKFPSFILKQVHYNFVYVQPLLQANPIGLLEVELLGNLFVNGRHLLQQLRILLVRAVGG